MPISNIFQHGLTVYRTIPLTSYPRLRDTSKSLPSIALGRIGHSTNATPAAHSSNYCNNHLHTKHKHQPSSECSRNGIQTRVWGEGVGQGVAKPNKLERKCRACREKQVSCGLEVRMRFHSCDAFSCPPKPPPYTEYHDKQHHAGADLVQMLCDNTTGGSKLGCSSICRQCNASCDGEMGDGEEYSFGPSFWGKWKDDVPKCRS
jgi:hypothetical protein